MNSPIAHSQLLEGSAERSGGLRDHEIGATLRRWAEQQPAALAFLHKRRGRWLASSRSHVVREVERRTTLLNERSLPGRMRLVTSGHYEPDLIMLALAALASGGEVFTLPAELRGDALARELSGLRPTHAFVQGRRAIAEWLAAVPEGLNRVPLFSAQAFVGGNSAWDVVPLHEPAASAEASPVATRWSWRPRPRFANVAWVDEGTEWHDALPRLLDSVLHAGVALAFPETTGSAGRDRRQIQPAALIVSPARRRRLEDEDRARRAREGTLSRQLVDRAEAAPGGLLARFVNHRRNAVLGLSRVRPLTAAEPATAAPAPASA
ncbi:MAG: hypothetical protein P4M07_02030 [Xanthobacteraceae bacterium]|nr:hypothetical protein [Xanthobacteraceae bacterium]